MANATETKKLFAATMKEMMTRIPFAKINIAELCKVCGKNRKSFYYHFKDKYALVNWIYYDEFVKKAQTKKYNDLWELLQELCDYLYDNREFYKKAFLIKGQNAFYEYLTSSSERLLAAYLNEALLGEEEQGFLVSFYIGALMNSVKRWLYVYPETLPERFIELVKEAIKNMGEIV